MTSNAVLNRYKEDAITMAPREKIVSMMFNHALKNMGQALEKLETQERGRFGLHISKSQAIVGELLSSLDHEVGGKLSRDLERLYLFVIDRLIDSNLKRQGKGIRESMRVLKTLKEGWDHANTQTA